MDVEKREEDSPAVRSVCNGAVPNARIVTTLANFKVYLADTYITDICTDITAATLIPLEV